MPMTPGGATPARGGPGGALDDGRALPCQYICGECYQEQHIGKKVRKNQSSFLQSTPFLVSI